MRSFELKRVATRRGLTLVEVLTVITILTLLTLFTLVAVGDARSAAARVGCSNNLRSVGLGLQTHQVTHGIFPPQQPSPGNSPGSSFSYEGIPWHVYTLPFIEQGPLWNASQSAFRQNIDPRAPIHDPIMRAVIPTYLCPSDGRLVSPRGDPDGVVAGFTSYVGMVGRESVFGRRRGIGPEAITDGLSQTILVGERPPPDSFRLGWWYTTHDFTGPASVNDGEVPPDGGSNAYDGGALCAGPRVPWPGFEGQSFPFFARGTTRNDCDRLHYWSLHPGGANFLFGDGSVRFLIYSAAPRLRDLASISGGEAPLD